MLVVKPRGSGEVQNHPLHRRQRPTLPKLRMQSRVLSGHGQKACYPRI